MKDKLILGGAQFGMPYGILNENFNKEISKKLLMECIKRGVKFIDTAQAYGESESIIGQILNKGRKEVKIITKAIINEYSFNCKEKLEEYIRSLFFISMKNLGGNYISHFLFHRFSQYREHRQIIKKVFSKLIEKKFLHSYGVSVQNEQEFFLSLQDPDISVIQLPFNILEWRFYKYYKNILEIKNKRNLKIYARSCFLQGLLISENQEIWKRAHVKNPFLIKDWLNSLMLDFKKDTLSELCISYVNSFPWIDGIIIGINTLEQFIENQSYFESKIFTDEEILYINNTRPKISENTLNPAKWIQ